MVPTKTQFVMLLAEDDPDDQLLAREALEATGLPHRLITLDDGQELIDYLAPAAAAVQEGELPDLIVIDLNLPRLNGRQVLEILKQSERLRHIPVVVLTTSKDEEDVLRCYDLGAAGFFTKPVSFEGLVHVLESIDQYWFKMVKLPPRKTDTE